MSDDEILRRLDGHLATANEHMARGNEHMARGNEHMARGNELFVELRELMRGMRRDSREFRAELGQQRRHNEAVHQAMIAELREGRSVLRDLVSESRAQRQALLRILDRMSGDGPAAAGNA
ncbi:MAG: hypothetical protein Q8O56_00545 [Solirubrobacteraceae bacterium]|nr:hypothetical protein [Solirubrobacteraceae bacterium]